MAERTWTDEDRARRQETLQGIEQQFMDLYQDMNAEEQMGVRKFLALHISSKTATGHKGLGEVYSKLANRIAGSIASGGKNA